MRFHGPLAAATPLVAAKPRNGAAALLVMLGVLFGGVLQQPAGACERHLDGHHNGSDTAHETMGH
jgi:hypothetical protein